MPQVCQRSTSELTSTRQQFLSAEVVQLLDSRSDTEWAAFTDLVACTCTGKRSCFLLLHWSHTGLLDVDLLFTEAEARARFDHGRIYRLAEFALPSSVLAAM